MHSERTLSTSPHECRWCTAIDQCRLSMLLEVSRKDLSHLVASASLGTSLLTVSRLACPCSLAKARLYWPSSSERYTDLSVRGGARSTIMYSQDGRHPVLMTSLQGVYIPNPNPDLATGADFGYMIDSLPTPCSNYMQNMPNKL